MEGGRVLGLRDRPVVLSSVLVETALLGTHGVEGAREGVAPRYTVRRNEI